MKKIPLSLLAAVALLCMCQPLTAGITDSIHTLTPACTTAAEAEAEPEKADKKAAGEQSTSTESAPAEEAEPDCD